MGFLAITVSSTIRTCLSVAITEMVIPLNNARQPNESLTMCSFDQSSTEQATEQFNTVSPFPHLIIPHLLNEFVENKNLFLQE